MERRSTVLISGVLTALIGSLVATAVLRGRSDDKVAGIRIQGSSLSTAPLLGSLAKPMPGQDPQPEGTAQSFLDSQRVSQQSRQEALRLRGVDGDREALRKIFRATQVTPPHPKNNMTPATLSALTNVFEDEVIDLLESLGFDSMKILSYRSQSLDPVSAAAAFLRGIATPSQTAILADLVVVGTITASSDSQIGDGYNSTSTVTIGSKLAGRDSNGTATIRQRSGRSPSGLIVSVSSDVTDMEQTPMVIMLSRNWYKQSVVEGAIRRKETYLGEDASARIILGQPYFLHGDTLMPAHNYGLQGSLAELRRTTVKA